MNCRQGVPRRSRLRAAKAITATADKLARIVYYLMRFGLAYVKRSEQQYAEEVRQRQESQLHRRARELGFEWHRVEPAVEAVVRPDGEVLKGTPEGVVVEA